MDGGCEFPKFQATSQEIKEILSQTKSIAVVGISPKEERPSHWISKYLVDHGFHVVGVNPGHSEILGIKVYKSLSEVPESVDMVDLFIRSENVPSVVDEAISRKVKFIWMQEGVINNAAAEKAIEAGLKVVMNKCIYKEHANL
ncbi:MAG: CoA-binding protein [Elusimicrobiota bacterium]